MVGMYSVIMGLRGTRSVSEFVGLMKVVFGLVFFSSIMPGKHEYILSMYISVPVYVVLHRPNELYLAMTAYNSNEAIDCNSSSVWVEWFTSTCMVHSNSSSARLRELICSCRASLRAERNSCAIGSNCEFQ